MKRIEAVIVPSTLDMFKAAAPSLGISEFELVKVYRLASNGEVRKGLYRGSEYTIDLSPRLRVEFVMFDDDVQATLHRLLELVHPESISVFRLDQEVRTLSSADTNLKDSPASDQKISMQGAETSAHAIGADSRNNAEHFPVAATRPALMRH